ncbi:hypothetical protein RSAG8_08240, partial [Rhizoctonia solani AG-8 WAC10335]
MEFPVTSEVYLNPTPQYTPPTPPADAEGSSDTCMEEHNGSDIPELEEGKIWARQHPSSKLRSAYLAPSASRQATHASLKADIPPHSPFRTRTDFLQAEIFSKFNASDKQIDTQLKMLHETGAYNGNTTSPLTLRNATDYHNVMNQAAGASEKATFSELVGDSDFADEFVYYPQQLFIRRSAQDPTPIVIIEELHHGTDWWEMQDSIAEDEHVLFIVIYVDETNVTTFGGVKVWPIYGWLGNLPASTRKSRNDKGGAILLGYLPEVNMEGKALSDSDLAELRVRVYHDALEVIFGPLVFPAQFGVSIKCGDGQTRKFRPVLGAISADYKELCRITCILGHQSGFPCPICLVPRSQQGDLNRTWPHRTVNGSEKLVHRAQKAKYLKDRDEILSEQSLRISPNILHEIIPSFFSVYRAIAADPLHQIEQGVFGKHLWPWIRDQLSNEKKATLDKRFRNIPAYPDLKHFPNGVTKLQNVTGKEHAVILRLLAPLIEDLLPQQNRKLILSVIRLLAEIHILAKFTTHTDDTLGRLEAIIAKFSPVYAKLASLYPAIGSDYPKVHSLSHLVDIIRRKGTTDNYHTGLGEALHPQSKRDYQHTNHQETFKEQMLRTYQERELIIRIRASVDCATKSLSNEDEFEEQQTTGEDMNTDRTSPHAVVAGRSYRMSTEMFAAQQRESDQGAQHFIRELRTFLYQEIDGLGDAFHFRERNLPRIDHIIMSIFPSLKVSYVSLLDSREHIDVLRVTDSWRGKDPRRDYVLFNDYRGLSVAQVLQIFKIRFQDVWYTIAYIRPLRMHQRSRTTGYVELKDDGTRNFIFVESIIRSCVVLSPDIHRNTHVLHDLEGYDMFLRLSNIK